MSAAENSLRCGVLRSCASSGNDTIASQSSPFCANADFYSSHNQHSQLCHALLNLGEGSSQVFEPIFESLGLISIFLFFRSHSLA